MDMEAVQHNWLYYPSTGKPVSHQFAKEMLAGLAGVEVDRLAETYGMNEYE